MKCFSFKIQRVLEGNFAVRTTHVSQRLEDVTDTVTAKITLMKSVVNTSTWVIKLSKKYLIQIRALLSDRFFFNFGRVNLSESRVQILVEIRVGSLTIGPLAGIKYTSMRWRCSALAIKG